MSKIDDKISLAERKLEEIKAKFEGDTDNLTSLIRQRAKLEAEAVLENRQDGKRVKEIDRQRDGLRSQLEIYPSLIKEVEGKIGALKKEKQGEILRKNLAEQKRAAREVEEFSQKLGSLLSEANSVNVELQKSRSQYLKLHELTGQEVITRPTTGGSQGWLRVLAGIIKAELAGEPRPMPRYPGAAPPI